MKKKILLIYILILIILPISVYASPGCCSHHGGESGCRGGRTVCSDGWTSSCSCDGTSSRSGGSGYSSSSSSNGGTNWEIIIFIGVILILVGPYILEFMKTMKEVHEDEKIPLQRKFLDKYHRKYYNIDSYRYLSVDGLKEEYNKHLTELKEALEEKKSFKDHAEIIKNVNTHIMFQIAHLSAINDHLREKDLDNEYLEYEEYINFMIERHDVLAFDFDETYAKW